MEKLTSHFLAGLATVLSVLPGTDYERFVPSRNAEARMRGHWERVGSNINKAMSRVAYEQQRAKETSS